jgi:hypothetical protein
MDPAPPPDWISAVTRPLRDNPELELAARQELSERVGSADPDQLGTIQRRFDSIDRAAPAKHRLLYLLPIVLAFLVVLGAGIPLILHVLFVSLLPLTHRAERYWIARDELMRPSPDGLGLNRLESDASRTLQSRLQQALQATPRGD